ncbi:MAG: insulinase family protein [Cryomorphaceae bacterium]|nr:insulinase family protein [Cryomorphaceae bacterium]
MGKIISFTLPNGIRVIHYPTESPIAHCGLFVKAGSRDELVGEQGLAHMVEHMLFKGTKHRKTFHILSRLDSVGGEINAFTTKEETCIYASFIDTYFARATDLIFDIAFNSIFPDHELNKEKDVVLEEIDAYKDNPAEQIFDDFEDMVFAGHPIGRNILGTPESVKSFSVAQIKAFISREYRPNQMVFCSVGKISEKKLRKILNTHLPENQHKTTAGKNRKPVNLYCPNNVAIDQNTHQAHIILGNRAYSATDKKSMGFSLLNNVLGGPALNNRLNLNIREKHGFAYHVESFYNPYSDTGIFGVYMGTDQKHIEQTIKLVERELKVLREKKLGVLQLHRSKKQWIGQIFLQQDSNLNLMLNLGKSVLLHEKTDTWEELNRKLNAITSEDLLEIANEIFNPQLLSRLIYH